ncbi:MAG TPA: hypothetical protein VEK38_02695 [Candidatus Bathyarchaeia archaeon]|nr:hypothetical protein [Candidatus Bathyarchaeia archaeon]
MKQSMVIVLFCVSTWFYAAEKTTMLGRIVIEQKEKRYNQGELDNLQRHKKKDVHEKKVVRKKKSRSSYEKEDTREVPSSDFIKIKRVAQIKEPILGRRRSRSGSGLALYKKRAEENSKAIKRRDKSFKRLAFEKIAQDLKEQVEEKEKQIRKKASQYLGSKIMRFAKPFEDVYEGLKEVEKNQSEIAQWEREEASPSKKKRKEAEQKLIFLRQTQDKMINNFGTLCVALAEGFERIYGVPPAAFPIDAARMQKKLETDDDFYGRSVKLVELIGQ